jgi:histo-blood group ABO system transferase
MEDIKPVALFVIATNKYVKFVKPLVESAEKHFLKDRPVDLFVFTDQFPGKPEDYESTEFTMPPGTKYSEELKEASSNRERIVVMTVIIQHKPWPYMTLERYKHFDAMFKFGGEGFKQRYSHVFYCDVDMLFVDDVGPEILTWNNSGLVATAHHGFWQQPRSAFTYETRPESFAFIPEDKGVFYYAGGFQGGSTDAFAYACGVMAHNIQQDLDKGIIAVWHDESHWNRYLIDNPPRKTLSPSYCFHEGRKQDAAVFKPLLVALDKNHSELRSV